MNPQSLIRLNWADCAKGLAIVLVVQMHTSLGVEAAFGQQGLMGVVAGYGASFRMPLFFIIAGVFLARAISLDWRSFLDKRVLPLVYFYVLWALILCVFKCLPQLEWDLTQLPYYLFTALYEPKSSLWFIYVLALFFVVARALRNVPALLVFACAVLLELAPIHTGFTVIDNFAANFIFFITGVLMAQKLEQFAAKASEKTVLVSVVFVLAAVANGVLYHYNAYTLPFMHLLLGITLPLTIIAFLGVVTRYVSLSWLAYCGKYSIVIYLSFFLPMVVMRTALMKTGLISNVDVVSLIVFVTSLLVPLALHRIIRNTPLMLVFKRPEGWRLPTSSRSVQPAE